MTRKNKLFFVRIKFYKRLSPLLLLAPVLFLVFLLSVISKEKEGLETLLLPVTVVNVLFVDFAVWNYFEGKKKLIIWISESILAVLIVYLLLYK
jgi:hypothetical protein